MNANVESPLRDDPRACRLERIVALANADTELARMRHIERDTHIAHELRVLLLLLISLRSAPTGATAIAEELCYAFAAAAVERYGRAYRARYGEDAPARAYGTFQHYVRLAKPDHVWGGASETKLQIMLWLITPAGAYEDLSTSLTHPYVLRGKSPGRTGEYVWRAA